MGNKHRTLVLRADKELHDGVLRHVERLKAMAPVLRVSEADAVRDLVTRGLAQVEGSRRKKRR